MQTAIVAFPGSNRERDAALALERATGKKAAYGLATAILKCRRSI